MKKYILALVLVLLLVGFSQAGTSLLATQSSIRADVSADTGWVSYTPTITSESGGWTNLAVTKARYRVTNGIMQGSFLLTFSGGSAAASQLYLSIPTGYTMDTANMAGGAGWDSDRVGSGIFGDSGTYSGAPLTVRTRSTTKLLLGYYATNAGNTLGTGLTEAAPITWAVNDTIEAEFKFPVTQP